MGLRLPNFEALPYFRESVMLRRWDDEAKTAGHGCTGHRRISRPAAHARLTLRCMLDSTQMATPTQALDEIRLAMASTNDIFNF